MWAAVLVAAVPTAAALLLLIPMELDCRARAEHVLDGSVQISWLFGLVRLRRRWRGLALLIAAARESDSTESDTTASESVPREPMPDERPTRRASASSKPLASRPLPSLWDLRVPPFMRTAAGRRRVLRLLRKLWPRIAVRRAEARLRIGLHDPADTGRLMGVLLPLTALLRPALPGPFVVTPDFVGPRLDGALEAALRVIPLRIMAPVLSFGIWLAWHGSKAERASS